MTALPDVFKDPETDLYDRTIRLAAVYLPDRSPDELLARFRRANVEITGSPELLASRQGQWILCFLVNLIARFAGSLTFAWRTEIRTPDGFGLHASVNSLAKRIRPTLSIKTDSHDALPLVTVSLGGGVNPRGAFTVGVNADGWLAYVTTNGNKLDWVSRLPNPVGAFFAATLAAGEVFKAILRNAAGRLLPRLNDCGSVIVSTFDPGFRFGSMINPPLPDSIPIDATTLVSLGAVHNATLATLVPCRAGGRLDVVEPQRFNATDLNRYVLGFQSDIGRAKTEIAQEAAGMGLSLVPWRASYETFRKDTPLPLKVALVGVDNHPARWAVQRDWPDVLLCAGTHWDTVQISRHVRSGPSCVGCVYPEGAEVEPVREERIEPTVSFVSAAGGILLAAELIKEVVPAFRPYRVDDLLYLSLLAPSMIQHRQVKRVMNCPCRCDQPFMDRTAPSAA